jgi:hypothetical protein
VPLVPIWKGPKTDQSGENSSSGSSGSIAISRVTGVDPRGWLDFAFTPRLDRVTRKGGASKAAGKVVRVCVGAYSWHMMLAFWPMYASLIEMYTEKTADSVQYEYDMI